MRSNRRERGEKKRGEEGERTKESRARAGREKRGRGKKEGENRQQGFGTPAHWHLGDGPTIGLCGQGND